MNRRIPKGSSLHLENLIAAYSEAIWSFPFDRETVNRLCVAVEREAIKVEYQGFARLLALHLAAEQMSAAVADLIESDGETSEGYTPIGLDY